MELHLKIEGKSGQIEIENEYLTKVELLFDSPNDNITDRSSEATLKIVIKGIISKKVTSQTLNILKWSLTKKEDVYRKTTVRIEDTDEIIREYILPHAFVIDYFEKTERGESSFKLLIAQKGDEIDKIEVSDK